MIQNTQIIVRYMYVHVNCHLLQHDLNQQVNRIWKEHHDAHYFWNALHFGSFQSSSVYKVIIRFHNKK